MSRKSDENRKHQDTGFALVGVLASVLALPSLFSKLVVIVAAYFVASGGLSWIRQVRGGVGPSRVANFAFAGLLAYVLLAEVERDGDVSEGTRTEPPGEEARQETGLIGGGAAGVREPMSRSRGAAEPAQIGQRVPPSEGGTQQAYKKGAGSDDLGQGVGARIGAADAIPLVRPPTPVPRPVMERTSASENPEGFARVIHDNILHVWATKDLWIIVNWGERGAPRTMFLRAGQSTSIEKLGGTLMLSDASAVVIQLNDTVLLPEGFHVGPVWGINIDDTVFRARSVKDFIRHKWQLEPPPILIEAKRETWVTFRKSSGEVIQRELLHPHEIKKLEFPSGTLMEIADTTAVQIDVAGIPAPAVAQQAGQATFRVDRPLDLLFASSPEPGDNQIGKLD